MSHGYGLLHVLALMYALYTAAQYTVKARRCRSKLRAVYVKAHPDMEEEVPPDNDWSVDRARPARASEVPPARQPSLTRTFAPRAPLARCSAGAMAASSRGRGDRARAVLPRAVRLPPRRRVPARSRGARAERARAHGDGRSVLAARRGRTRLARSGRGPRARPARRSHQPPPRRMGSGRVARATAAGGGLLAATRTRR